MWLDVIAKMDEVYSDLLRYETDLEYKNSALEEAQAFISSVIARSPTSSSWSTPMRRVLQVNPAFVRLVGEPEAALVGRRLEDLLAPADRAAAPAIAAAPEPVDRELRFLTRDGPSDLMAVAGSPRLDHAGRRAGVVLTGRPIGELRRAYEALHRAHAELQQAQRKLVEQEKMASLGRLVAGVAHELNNPISFVYGNIHTLDRYRRRLTDYLAGLHAGGDPDELRRTHRIDALVEDLGPLIDGTLEGAVRVADIVRNLRRLSFTRPGDHQSVDLEKIARTAATWSAKAKGDGTAVTIAAEPDVTVVGNEGQLHQVVVNLVENALDAVRGRPTRRSPSPSRTRVDMIDLTVRDNGPGVSAAVADKIFEPFFTTRRSAKAPASASGSAIRSPASTAANSCSTPAGRAARPSRSACPAPGEPQSIGRPPVTGISAPVM